MTRKEYVYHLKNRLRDLPSDEIESALTYVNELFDDAGEENELQVVSDLGSPSKFAAQIKAEYTISQKYDGRPYEQNRKKNSGWKTFGIIILGIFALPIGFPIAIALLAVIFILVAVSFVLCLVLGVIAITAFFSMGALLYWGFKALAYSAASGLVAIGASLMGFSGVILVICGIIYLYRCLKPSMIHGASNTYNRLKGGSKNEGL